MLPYLLYALLLLLSLAAISLNILSLPGNWIMLAAATALYLWRGTPTITILLILLVVLLAGETVEVLGSLVGAKKFGASSVAAWAAIAGAFVGGLLGFLIPVPLIGNILGAILGAFLIAWIIELLYQKPLKAATFAALGAALGRAMGMTIKISCGLLAWLTLLIFAFPTK